MATTFSSLFIGISFAIKALPAITSSPVIDFQFPFHRDQLCDVIISKLIYLMDILSVPFSSGSALRSGADVALAANAINIFQFPFHRDQLCDQQFRKYPWFFKEHFQFPFHRDQLCDLCLPHSDVRPAKLSVPFSSGSALRFTSGAIAANAVVSFQFPFHRDQLCDLINRYD